MNKELLKCLPKMDELLCHPKIAAAVETESRKLVTDSLRESLEISRNSILSGSGEKPDIDHIVIRGLSILENMKRPNLRPVINATGIILHTNLGRSKLSENACKAIYDIAKGYSNLEYDILTGKRGSRYDCVARLITDLTGAEDALVVNNNAAAVWLVLNALGKGKRVLVSRGELVEIGGQFRVPDIMEQSGCLLVEVGTTNKTHLSDYERNMDEESLLLKVHTSNFKVIGFTEEVPLASLAALGKKSGVPVIYDLGSGSLVDFEKHGVPGEPYVKKAVGEGADVICFSGDKLLGGPQAGIIIGKKEFIAKIKRNPLNRALRIDKLTLAALEATLREYVDEEQAIRNVPILSQIFARPGELKEKAERLLLAINQHAGAGAALVEDRGQIGGGSMPGYEMVTWAVAVKPAAVSLNSFEKMLREQDIPVIIRISNDQALFDVLTIEEEDFDYIGRCVAQCLENSKG